MRKNTRSQIITLSENERGNVSCQKQKPFDFPMKIYAINSVGWIS